MSPELALVDPKLRAAAREQLADPEDTLARLARAARVKPEPARVAETRAGPAWSPDDATSAAARRLAHDALAAEPAETLLVPTVRRLPRLVAIVAATSAGFTLALLVADRQLESGQTSLTSAMLTAAKPPVSAGSALPTAPSRAATPSSPTGPSGKAPALAPRRFAWAPVRGASGYHVELHRAATRIFAADTTRPAITIPAEWRFANREHRLEAVEYRWYVWPIVSGRRATKAVVQARLADPDR